MSTNWLRFRRNADLDTRARILPLPHDLNELSDEELKTVSGGCKYGFCFGPPGQIKKLYPGY